MGVQITLVNETRKSVCTFSMMNLLLTVMPSTLTRKGYIVIGPRISRNFAKKYITKLQPILMRMYDVFSSNVFLNQIEVLNNHRRQFIRLQFCRFYSNHLWYGPYTKHVLYFCHICDSETFARVFYSIVLPLYYYSVDCVSYCCFLNISTFQIYVVNFILKGKLLKLLFSTIFLHIDNSCLSTASATSKDVPCV